MAVVLRLRREGKKKQPFYRIVATDERFPRNGRFIEIVGQYNPLPEKEDVNIDEERVLYWMSVGAKPTNTLKNVLSRAGYWKQLVSNLEALHTKERLQSENDAVKTEEAIENQAVNTPTEADTEPISEGDKEE